MNRKTLKRLLDAFDTALDWMELSHSKCDINDDKDCYAEQYGDGDVTQHKFLRVSRNLWEEAGS